MKKTILLLGSGELGKELAISLARHGQRVVAVDSYDGAPAHQVTPFREVVDMLDGAELDRLVDKWNPDLVVPEIEALRTSRFYDYEAQGIQVVPSAKAANFTMDRRQIRDLAARQLGIPTAPYRYADDLQSLRAAAEEIGFPCVVKPLMSSSGKGQSLVRDAGGLETAWEYASSGGRGDLAEVIVEGFVEFFAELTLLTVTQKNGETRFCPPIGHIQEGGDYVESWQPCEISPEHLKAAQTMADQVTRALGGAGIWGVEFFLTQTGVVFSELSPRPHDTGMVTLGGTQSLSEFDLHARAILGLPIGEIELVRPGASAVVRASSSSSEPPQFSGVEEALSDPLVDVRLFGKPTTRKNRRMAVCLASSLSKSVEDLRIRAKEAAGKVQVV